MGTGFHTQSLTGRRMLLFGRDQNADPTASLTQKESELLPAVGCRSQTCRLWWRCQGDKLRTHYPWVLWLEGKSPQDFSLHLWHSLCDPVIPFTTGSSSHTSVFHARKKHQVLGHITLCACKAQPVLQQHDQHHCEDPRTGLHCKN